MSKYNSYAKKLDEYFREARDKYATAAGKLEDAMREDQRARAWYTETYVGERAAKQATASAKLREVTAQFRADGRRIWEEFDRKALELRKEFVAAVKAGSIATPEDVDMAALKLLESGVCSGEDMLMLSEKFDTNQTMLKLIGKYAHEAADRAREAGNNMEAVRFATVSANSKNGESKMVKLWDDLATMAKYCSGVSSGADRRTTDPAHTVKMGREWEGLTTKAIENF